MSDQPETEKQEDLHEPLKRQVTISAVGEMVAFTLAIGAVYVSERMMPKQTEAFVQEIAGQMAKWRGASVESQKLCAKKILDVAIMNMAGATGMAAQFGIRRAHQKEEDKMPLWYEASRLLTGRVVGTFTALSTLALMETRAPKWMRKMEGSVSKGTNDRFGELLVSNSVQTVGAIVGNAPAQLLYDHLVNPPQKEPTR